MLRSISVAVLCVLVDVSLSFPMCTDGHPPLMELNDAFPCSRGCPKGFDCEMQDPLLTASMGICCANRTELLLLYGNDNQKHADPIWNRKDPIQSVKTTSTTAPPSPQLSTTKVNNVAEANTDFHGSLTTSTSSSVSTTEEASSSFSVPTIPPNEENSVVVTENDEVFDETSPASETDEEKSVSIDGSSATNSTASSASTAAGGTKISSEAPQVKVQENNSTQNEDDGANGGQSKVKSSLPIETKQALNSSTDKGAETDSTVSASGNTTVPPIKASDATIGEELDDGDALEGSSAPIEDSVKVFSARVDDETLTGEPDQDGTDPEVKESALKEGQSAANKTAHDVGRRDATGNSPLEMDEAASEEGHSTEKNAVVEAVNTASSSNETTEKLEDSNKDQKISDVLQNSEEATSPLEDEQTTYSCERQPYIFRCRSDSVDTQPTIRWYLSENSECEYYPWGYCPGDRIAESTTIRTKTECERECMKKEKGGTKETLPEVPADFSDDDEKTEAELEQKALELQKKPENTSPTPEEKNTAVEPSAITGSGEQPNYSSSPSAPDKAMNGTIDNKDQEKEVVSEALPAVTELDAISTIDKSTNQSDTSATDEKKAPEGEMTENSSILNIVETSQNQTTETKAVVAVTIERKENVHNEGSRKHICDDLNEGNQTTTETDESKQTETELAEGSGEAGDEKSKGSERDIFTDDTEQVLCSRTSYRFLCESGMPSQFVYRWEMENGTCQSFPYGYCLSEWNHPHPRTADECEQLC